MKTSVLIALIGDYQAEVRAHVAIPQALALAARAVGCEVEPLWTSTSSILGDATDPDVSSTTWSSCDGLWCVPASPYEDMAGALHAIQFARENNRPFLGTCGGFQHAVIEYARTVLGLAEADHVESNPDAGLPLISPLTCSLVGARGRIGFEAGSRVAAIYGRTETEEEYHCRFGVNPRFENFFQNGALRITGRDESGEPRVVELEDHPFFMATLFQPELSALRGSNHPVIVAFVRAAAQQSSKTAAEARSNV